MVFNTVTWVSRCTVNLYYNDLIYKANSSAYMTGEILYDAL